MICSSCASRVDIYNGPVCFCLPYMMLFLRTLQDIPCLMVLLKGMWMTHFQFHDYNIHSENWVDVQQTYIQL